MQGQITTKGNPELLEMASDLPRWAVILSSYLTDESSEPKKDLAGNLEKELQKHLKALKAQLEAGAMKRALGSCQKMEKLKECYRRIETSFRQLHILRLNELLPSHNARYDSSFSLKVERGACLQNTRTTVLQEAYHWIYHASDTKIYWINGMAGTGKTTIAYSISLELKKSDRLGASFFCSRAASDCQDINRILPTIAYQLSQQFYPFKSTLCRILGREPSISQRDLLVQFQYLIRDPLLEVRDLLPSGIIVVIDALDECLNPKATEIILGLLFQDAGRLPIRFFLTSRPDPSISNTIMSQDARSRSVLHLHNVDQQLVEGDIETYLTASLAKISIPSRHIKQLAEQAGVLFIYASTVARYILSGRAGANRSARLKAVLAKDPVNRSSKKTQELDRLYATILQEAFEDDQLEVDEVNLIKRVLWVAVSVREPVTQSTLAGILGADLEQVSVALEPLRSVLNVLEENGMVSTLHASFPEFVLSPERSGGWSCCDDRLMATKCFEIMQDQLRFNICDLETSSRLDREVPDLRDRVTNAISPELSYVCQHWLDHVRSLGAYTEFLPSLNDFLRGRLLFWMEVLNLKGKIDKGVRVLTAARSWLSVSVTSGAVGDGGTDRPSPQGDPDVQQTHEMLSDALQFAHIFATNPVHQSTPHIYVSCLSLACKESKLWRTYRKRTRGLLWVGGTGVARWQVSVSGILLTPYQGDPARLSRRTTHVPLVNDPPPPSRLPIPSRSLSERRLVPSPSAPTARPALSSTTRRIGLSSPGPIEDDSSCAPERSLPSLFDGLSLQQASRSELYYPKNLLSHPPGGHTAMVTAVQFSPDGTRIVSSFGNVSLQVWDSWSGAPLVTSFGRHANWVTSIAFSMDGSRIASGSADATLRVWDSQNGTPLAGPFRGHGGGVTSVAFSPDGNHIVSGSKDRTVRIWDPYKNAVLVQTLRGHTGAVTSVVYSPGAGNRIVTGSEDMTLRVWDSRSGALLSTLSRGHARNITTVTFSPDGNYIVSASWDRTIRVWDSYDGTLLGHLFKGHTEVITSISVSPDSTRIVSGSGDATVRVWDLRSGAQLAGPFRGHHGGVTSVSFSPDGNRVASGSRDGTVRVWDVRSGTPLANPFKNYAFSPPNARTEGTSNVSEAGCGVDNDRASLQLLCPGPWNTDSDGWVMPSPQLRLLWLPKGLKDMSPAPSNVLVIKDTSLQIRWNGLFVGDNWRKCYSDDDM